MLGINHTKNAKHTKDYYPKDDYYGRKGSIIGNWAGKAAGLLGLAGEVKKEYFARLCDNLHPFKRKKITKRTREDRRPAYDFTFSLWKSASVLYTLFGDERILDVFAAAVLSTMQAIEPFMEARVRIGGADYNRVTGNMVVAPFLHHLSRPENGQPDPHLHVHMVAMNMTWDEIERKWKAGQFGRIKSMGHFFEELFDAKLAAGIRSLGYEVERRGKTSDFEIKDVPDAVVRKFSQRTKVIEAKAAELKVRDRRQKAALNKVTRKAKIDDQDMDQLETNWKARLTFDEHDALAKVVQAAVDHGPVVAKAHPTAQEMVDYAIEHLFERCSVLEEHQLLAAAMEYGSGAVTVDELKRALETSQIIREEIDGTVFLTTEAVLREELECVAFAKDTRGTLGPIRIVTEPADPTLSPEQWLAFKHVLESRDRVTAISGSPGSGKTTVMTPIIDGIKKEGLEVFTFAPSAEASRKVLRDEGFTNADTVTKFLLDPKLQEKAAGQVVWIDEAGLIGATDMHRLFALSQERNFRLVLSGDIGQHGPVPRGDALRLLIKHAGLKPAHVNTVRRQKEEIYKEAVQKISDGDVETAFAQMDQAGFIREIDDDDDRLETLADEYLRVLNRKNDCLVVSPTHKEGRKVTGMIREKLKQAKRLGEEQAEVFQLENLRWTEAQRANPALYAPGMMVQFHQNPGEKISRGDRFTVTAVKDGKVEMRGAANQVLLLPLAAARHFNVFEQKTLSISSGELLRVTANGMSKNECKLENGNLLRVKSLNREGDIICTNGAVLDASYGHVTHGYCATSMSSQGKTVDHVLVAQSAESLGKASSLEQFKVSVSRGRHSLQIFTDDKQGLLRAVSKSSARPLAHDIVGETRRQQLLLRSKIGTVHGRNQAIKDFPREISAPVVEMPDALPDNEQAESQEQDIPTLPQEIAAPIPETPADLPDLDEQTNNQEQEIEI